MKIPMAGFIKSYSRIRWAALVLALSLILAACGGAQSTPTPTTAPTLAATATAIPAEETTPEESAIAETEETEAVDTVGGEATDEATEEAAEADEADEVEATESSSAGGETGTTDGPTVSITQINTSLRSGPGTAYEILTRTTVSETFPVTARFGEGTGLWYQVTLDDGTSAWVWARVATLNPPDAEIPVAEDVPPAP